MKNLLQRNTPARINPSRRTLGWRQPDCRSEKDEFSRSPGKNHIDRLLCIVLWFSHIYEADEED